MVVYSLENTGFSAKGFENGKQFFDGLDESSLPDMVLLDIMLPGEDGVSILKKAACQSQDQELAGYSSDRQRFRSMIRLSV